MHWCLATSMLLSLVMSAVLPCHLALVPSYLDAASRSSSLPATSGRSLSSQPVYVRVNGSTGPRLVVARITYVAPDMCSAFITAPNADVDQIFWSGMRHWRMRTCGLVFPAQTQSYLNPSHLSTGGTAPHQSFGPFPEFTDPRTDCSGARRGHGCSGDRCRQAGCEARHLVRSGDYRVASNG